jgi:hypothetical protein
MLKHFNRMKGQSTLEYAILIIIIIGALLTIQTYIKRGVQGRLKGSADDIGEQYSSGNTNVVKSTKTKVTTKETFGGEAGQGVAKSEIQGNEITNSTSSSQILNVDQEYWGTKASE